MTSKWKLCAICKRGGIAMSRKWLCIQMGWFFFYFFSNCRTIRVWLRRDSGQYWPSICQYMPSGCTSIDYHSLTRQIFIGQDNGTVSQYTLSGDCNSLTMVRDYLAHQARVTGVFFAPKNGWILSCGRDKLFSFHSTDTTSRLGGYTFESLCTAIQYPFLNETQKKNKIFAFHI